MTDEEKARRWAPDDAIWVCGACGKTALDQYGIEGAHSWGWDESCAMHAVLCRRGDIVPGQIVQHAEPYERRQADRGEQPR